MVGKRTSPERRKKLWDLSRVLRQRFQRLLQRRVVADIQASLGTIDLPHQSAKDFPGPNLYEGLDAPRNQLMHTLLPPDGARHLPRQRVECAQVIGHKFGVYIASHWIHRRLHSELLQVGFQPVLRGLHQRTMEWSADR